MVEAYLYIFIFYIWKTWYKNEMIRTGARTSEEKSQHRRVHHNSCFALVDRSIVQTTFKSTRVHRQQAKINLL
jgi:hypothetical protein